MRSRICGGGKLLVWIIWSMQGWPEWWCWWRRNGLCIKAWLSRYRIKMMRLCRWVRHLKHILICKMVYIMRQLEMRCKSWLDGGLCWSWGQMRCKIRLHNGPCRLCGCEISRLICSSFFVSMSLWGWSGWDNNNGGTLTPIIDNYEKFL